MPKVFLMVLALPAVVVGEKINLLSALATANLEDVHCYLLVKELGARDLEFHAGNKRPASIAPLTKR